MKWLKELLSTEIKSPTLKDRVKIHMDKRTEESDVSFILTTVSIIFTLSLIATKIYGYNEARVQAGLVALGAVSVAFSMMGKSGSAGVIARFFIKQLAKVFIITSLLLEVVSITGSYLSASGGGEVNQQRAIKERAIQTIKDLRLDIKDVKNSSTSDNVKAFDTREIKAEIKTHNANANMIIKGSENILFVKINKYFKIENSESLYSALLVSMLIIGGSLLWTQRNWYWSNLSLWIYIAQAKRTDKLIASCEAQTKTAIKPAFTDKGTQETKPMDSSVFDRDFKAACDWVKGHKVGQRVYVGKMQKACKGGASWQHEAMLNGLQGKDVGLLLKKDNGGTSPLYYRKEMESKKQVNLRDTFKPFQLVK